MASKRVLSPAYAKRIASAMARGKSRQEARGHRSGEATRRREREREEFGLSGSEIRSIRSWVGRYPNEAREVEDIIDQARESGYEWFKNYRDVWNRARRQYLREQAAGTYSTRGLGHLEMLTAEADATDIAWLYYH